MKQILKNLWSQRAQNVWLFAELVVVCFVAWTQIDPIAVRLFYQNQPAGFDIDRLVVADARLYKTMGQNIYDHDGDEYYQQTSEQFTREMKQLKQHLLELDEVAYVSFLDAIEGYPRMNKSYMGIPLPNDTISVPWCYFNIGQDFFETFGIQPLPGSPSQHDLSMNTGGRQSLILTRSLAERIYGSAEAAIGKNLDSGWTYVVKGNKTSIIYTILGVVEDVGARTDEYSTWMAFSPNGHLSDYQPKARLAIRLKPEVNMQRFVEEQTYRTGELASEHYVICEFFPYVDAAKNIDSVHSADFNAQSESDYDFNLSVATAIFFLINLCLGVIGTFWMQTKRRTEESGIMRAFGATKRRIMGMFLAEGFVLTTFSMFITCILYLNYVKTGLGELCIPYSTQPDPTWVADKPLHFLIISGIVYLIILLTVSIGILIPSWNICRMKPMEALRDG